MNYDEFTVHNRVLIGHKCGFWQFLSGDPYDEYEHDEQDEEAAGQVVRSPAALVLGKKEVG